MFFKSMRNVSFLTLCLLLVAQPAMGEGKAEKKVAALVDSFSRSHGDFFRLFLGDRSDISFTYRFEPQTEEESGPGEYELNLFRLEGEVPLPQDRDFFLRAGGVYEARRYEFSAVRSAKVAPSTEILHTAALRLGAGLFFGDDLLLTGSATLGAYSDFSGSLDDQDFDVQGEVLLVYRLNPGAQIVAGVANTKEFEDVDILPLFGVRLLSEDGKVHISITAPRDVTVSYAFNPELRLYGGGWLSGNEYRVDIDGEEFNVAIRERRFGIGLQWLLGQRLRFTLEGGLLIGSELDFRTEDAGQFEGDLDTAPYLGAGLGFSF